MAPKITIIGAGIIGLSAARALLSAGYRVTVIEQGRIGQGATRAAAGMLCPWQEAPLMRGPLDQALADFSAQSQAAWPDYAASLEEETGLDVDFRGVGSIALGFPELTRKVLARQAPSLKETIPAELQALFADSTYDLASGVLLADEAQVDPVRMAAALAASIRGRGGEIFEDTEVTSVAEGHIELAGGGKKSTDIVILASGMGVNRFWAEKTPPPLRPVKGQALSLQTGDLFPDATPVVRTPDVYICPKAHGRTVIGATQETDRDDLETDDILIEELRSRAVSVVPALANCDIIERWAGLRPAAPDLAPIIGRSSEVSGLYYAAAHFRHGILLAPQTAALLSEMMRGEETSTPFGVERLR